MITKSVRDIIVYGKEYKTKTEDFIFLYPKTTKTTIWKFLGIPIYTSVKYEEVYSKDKELLGVENNVGFKTNK